MPFDPITPSVAMTRDARFTAASGRERLKMLAEDLEGALLNWEWDFPSISNATLHHCGTEGCALGYAAARYTHLKKKTRGGYAMTFDEAQETFEISSDVAAALFYSGYAPKQEEDVRPFDVAAKIREYLRTGEV